MEKTFGRDGKDSELLDLFNEIAVFEIGRIDTLKLVERDKLDSVQRARTRSFRPHGYPPALLRWDSF